VYLDEPGTNGQHSFYQMIRERGLFHVTPRHSPGEPVRAQAEALAFGKTAEQVHAEGTTPDWLVPTAFLRATARRTRFWPSASRRKPSVGSSPSTEHNVFTRARFWGIDSFDPWGGELGKQLAQRIIPELESKEEPAFTHDSSTNNLINHYRQLKEAL
jgi:glucose-6-phosphate isomerase